MADTMILLAVFTYAATLSILFQDLEKASIFDSVTTVVSSWITEFGYPAVFLVALLENLFPPIPSEIIFPLVGFVAFHNNLGILHVIAVFSGRMAPAVRELISIPAGIGRMNLIKFVLFTFAGSAIWSVALTLLGYFLGDAWRVMANQLSDVLSIVVLIIIATVIL